MRFRTALLVIPLGFVSCSEQGTGPMAAPPEQQGPAAPVGAGPGAPVLGEPGSGEGVAAVDIGFDNETNMEAFNIHRGDTPDGPWALVHTMRGQGAGVHGRQIYRFVDTGLPVGRVYYYMIESVQTGGRVFRSTPIRYVAQLPASPEATAAPASE